MKKEKNDGHFVTLLSFGQKRPDVSGKIVIRSELPLVVGVNDTQKYFSFEEKREGKHYVYTATILKPIYRDFTDSEASSYIGADFYPTIAASSMKLWPEVVQRYLKPYESAIKAELPPTFDSIRAEAAKKKDLFEKINFVVEKIGQQVAYSGDWRTRDKKIFPRGHANVVKLKTGDCKDFAVTTTAILRKLGIKSDVAFVSTGKGYDWASRGSLLRKDLVPSASFFDHAIVRVTDRDKVYWVDPTLAVGTGGAIPTHIVGSLALVISAETTSPVQIADNSSLNNMVHEFTVTTRGDGTAEFEVKSNFMDSAGAIFKYLAHNSKDTFEKVVGSLVGAGEKERPIISVVSKVDSIATNVKFTSRNPAVETKDSTFSALVFPDNLKTLAYASKSRVTPLYLGELGKTKITFKMKTKFDYLDEADGMCSSYSTWADIKRRVSKLDDGYTVTSEVNLKKTNVTVEELQDKMFWRFVADVDDCMNKSMVQIKGKRAEEREKLNEKFATVIGQPPRKMYVAWLAAPPGESGYLLTRMLLSAEKALEKDSKDPEALSVMAIAIRRLGYHSGRLYDPSHLMASIEIAERAYKIAPTHFLTLAALSRNFGYLANFPAANRYFSELYKLAPKDSMTFSLGGELALMQKKNEDALKWYTAALNVSTTADEKASAYDSIAGVYYEMEKPAEAVKAYEQATQLEPKNAWLWNNLASAYNLNKDWDKGIAAGKKALEIMDFGMAKRNISEGLLGKAMSLKRDFKPKPGEDPRAPFRNHLLAQVELGLEAIKYDSENTRALDFVTQTYGNVATNSPDEFEKYDRLADEYGERLMKLRPWDPTPKVMSEIRKKHRMRVPAGGTPGKSRQ